MRDPRDTGLSREQAGPELGDIMAEAVHGPESSDHHAAGILRRRFHDNPASKALEEGK
jgi:hypothetical protein